MDLPEKRRALYSPPREETLQRPQAAPGYGRVLYTFAEFAELWKTRIDVCSRLSIVVP